MAFPVDKAWLVERYIPAIDLTDDQGNEYPANFYTNAIDVARAMARIEFDLPIERETVVERLDFDLRDYQAWQFLTLSKVPVISVTSVAYQYGNAAIMNVPADWYYLEGANTPLGSLSGQLQMIPNMATIETPFIPIIGGMPVWLGPTTPGGMDFVPGWFKVTYEAGWDDDKIPADILHWISLNAAIEVLNTAGDLIAGAGVASFSIGADSIHNSVNTTSSATNSGYGARIGIWKDTLKTLTPLIRSRYRGASQWAFA